MASSEALLAVDLGLRTGLALYGSDGRLRWYRSQNFGARARLKKGLYTMLRSIPDLTQVVLEGGGDLAHLWTKEAQRRGLNVRRIDAHQWRRALLLPREQRSGALAKAHADVWARRVIAWSGATAPTSLRHDAAEAIMIGLWGVQTLGWLPKEVFT
ncbi:MAG: hypothetical protein AAGJ10_12845 [Bacteroidota bacterium]